MVRRCIAGALGALLFPLCAVAQTHSALPVNIEVLCAPTPVTADAKVRLVYELRLTNFSRTRVELAGIDVTGRKGVALASFHDEALEPLVAPVGPQSAPGQRRSLAPGQTVTIFLDLTLAPQAAAPADLHHRLLFSYVRKNGAVAMETVEGPVAVIRQAAPVIGAPLRGSGWVAVNGLFNPDHRRSFNAVDGREHLAQRFAIDWVQLSPDGRFFHGDPKSNASYYDFGAEVLAVADGRVSGLTDGLPENAGNNPASERNVTLDNITGNSIVLDLGQGRFALYAHLQPGSLRVKVGDQVKIGQVLARLGNTGNSDAPHLHFQLMDANSPLGAEGIPYELTTFTELGVLNDPAVWEEGKAWRPDPGVTPVVRHRELPIDNAVVSFP